MLGLSLGLNKLTSIKSVVVDLLELIENGGFDTDLSSWTLTGTTAWTWSAGKATIDATAASGAIQQTVFRPYMDYVVALDVEETSGGGITLYRGISTNLIATITDSGSYSEEIYTGNAGSNTMLYINANSGWIGSIDNVSVKEKTDYTLGAEELTNGDFSDGFTTWDANVYYTLVDGAAYHASSSSYYLLRTEAVMTTGNDYLIEIDIEVASGDVRAFTSAAAAANSLTLERITSTGVYRYRIPGNTNSPSVSFSRWSGTTAEFTVNSVSIKVAT